MRDHPREPCRVHITGASGSGTSTLGRTLANAWSVPFHDVDDYYWEPTEPPYQTPRDAAERLHLMERLFVPRRAWVLSGNLMGWGDGLLTKFDLVVFVYLAPTLRLARLRTREVCRYGAAAIGPGGAHHEQFVQFMRYAESYDDPEFDGRSLTRHRAWLAAFTGEVMELDGSRSASALVKEITEGV